METAFGRPSAQQTHLMNALFSRLRPSLSLYSSRQLVSLFSTQPPIKAAEPQRSLRTRGASRSSVKAADVAVLKENWLDSLSCPYVGQHSSGLGGEDPTRKNSNSIWVIGIDPDLSGALALLKTDESGCFAQVFDSPHLPVLIGKRVRKRLDTKSIVQLLRSLDAPSGTTAYIEQSIPYPKDGKQGWWSGGFGYGLWIGILVASGFSVVPVPSLMWKNGFQLAGGSSTKDDSRRLASELFPSLSSQLSRKKDHGRAEALLIAAYGKGLKRMNTPVIMEEELIC